ncbi:hypothetical protein BQ8482_330214 [Mesorhizobium delmotii]|uniref:Uncharacterized protein n=1 Tax=Mesorhizobium delmotii TaxID=1631247 RepID=A0A2P9APL9_9HYPH|nr:hypothetical protein BQ8482_330214 [Mesorhizobium delmotii]
MSAARLGVGSKTAAALVAGDGAVAAGTRPSVDKFEPQMNAGIRTGSVASGHSHAC